jgi:hypothetical protein
MLLEVIKMEDVKNVKENKIKKLEKVILMKRNYIKLFKLVF